MDYIDLLLDMKKYLTPQQYKIFTLKVIKGMSFVAISDIIGISPSAVRQNYARARHRIIKLKQIYRWEIFSI